MSQAIRTLIRVGRKTTFRYTAVTNPGLEQVFARHAGARRFAYNQCLHLVKEALDHRGSDPPPRFPGADTA